MGQSSTLPFYRQELILCCLINIVSGTLPRLECAIDLDSPVAPPLRLVASGKTAATFPSATQVDMAIFCGDFLLAEDTLTLDRQLSREDTIAGLMLLSHLIGTVVATACIKGESHG